MPECFYCNRLLGRGGTEVRPRAVVSRREGVRALRPSRGVVRTISVFAPRTWNPSLARARWAHGFARLVEMPLRQRRARGLFAVCGACERGIRERLSFSGDRSFQLRQEKVVKRSRAYALLSSAGSRRVLRVRPSAKVSQLRCSFIYPQSI